MTSGAVATAADLETAFARLSPRLSPRGFTPSGLVIHLTVLGLAIVAIGGTVLGQGLFLWSAGLLFMAYDAGLLLFVTGQTLTLRQPTASAVTPALPPITLGVVVAAYNEAAVLTRTINALLAQTSPPDLIVIADDGSCDGTAWLLTKEYGFDAPRADGSPVTSPRLPCLQWLRAPHGGKARTLNRALARITTDLIVTVDADTLLAPDALAQMRRAFAMEPHLAAATGVLTPVCDDTMKGQVLQRFQTCEYIRNFMARFAWMKADSLLLVSGAFAAFRTSALRRVGGFDPACLVEDYEVIHRIHRLSTAQGLDWRIRVIGSARARTSAPSTLTAFLRQRRRWFAGFLQTQYWNRDMTGNRAFGRLGTWMLPVKVMDTVQPLCGLTALITLLLLALGHHQALLNLLLSIVATKVALDLLLNAWGLHLYRRWTGNNGAPALSTLLLVTLLEPLFFQPLRHASALLGWYYFLTGRQHWGRQQRHAMT